MLVSLNFIRDSDISRMSQYCFGTDMKILVWLASSFLTERYALLHYNTLDLTYRSYKGQADIQTWG